MAAPRYLFTARVVPSAAGTEPRIAWRLVGGNNHELGRSFSSFETMDVCTDAVHRLQQRIGQAQPEETTSDGQSGWLLRLDGEDVATSCRWYRRPREAQYNLLQFLAVAPSAALSATVSARPPNRELLRPEFRIPHVSLLQDAIDEIVAELPDQDLAATTTPTTTEVAGVPGRAEAS